jgi:energy-coupling factor transporter ATP-binding protein EcfA2
MPSASTAVTSSSLTIGPTWTLGRLTKLEIADYRAVRGHFSLEIPDGANVIIYGENGSGKSSIFYALRDFLESPERFHFANNGLVVEPLPIGTNRHRFTSDEPRVVLHFGEHQFAWSTTERGPEDRNVRDLNKGKGFLDYRVLQAVHYLPFDESEDVDLFKLLIGRLLPYYVFSYGGRQEQFQTFWRQLNRTVKQQWHHNEEAEFLSALHGFNAALEVSVNDLGSRASNLLAAFDDEFQVELKFMPGEFRRKPKRIIPPTVLVTPSLRKLKIGDYNRILNEARLSALAVCLFFAALQASPATSLRILALDDILIGLDMSNRLNVLSLIEKHFSDWQIFFLTYSKAWFELLKDRLRGTIWSAKWESFVLRDEWFADENSPRIVVSESGDQLKMARSHLAQKDYKAAAVYARSALEALCHRFCARARIAVVHVELAKERTLEDFLVALEKRLAELKDDARRLQAAELLGRIREAREFVLNRKSHFDVEDEDTLSAEVGAALVAVADFGAFLAAQVWKRQKFKEGQTFSNREMYASELAEARELKQSGHSSEALKKMAVAHTLAWEEFGNRNKVLFPLGAPRTASAIWSEAVKQKLIDALLVKKLEAARPYLYGSVEHDKFDAAGFDDGVSVLAELVQVAPK